MANILEAVKEIVENPITAIHEHYSGRNRANNVGSALELFIKDAFSNSLGNPARTDDERNLLYNQHFSYLGNQNNPPDIIIGSGDAIEVKKIQSPNADLALNSSYPKSKIYSSSPMITQACRDCEVWTEKDIIYCIGHTNDNNLKSLWMVYGSIYAANNEIYERIKHTISAGVNSIENVEFAETKELGRVNKVDPLGITNLRIRGMWGIQNPKKVFSYVHQMSNDSNFQLVTLLPTTKYESFPSLNRESIESIINPNFNISEVNIKNPNNPAQLVPCNLITFRI